MCGKGPSQPVVTVIVPQLAGVLRNMLPPEPGMGALDLQTAVRPAVSVHVCSGQQQPCDGAAADCTPQLAGPGCVSVCLGPS